MAWMKRTPFHCASLIATALDVQGNLAALSADPKGDIVTMAALEHPVTDVPGCPMLTAHAVAEMDRLDELPMALITPELLAMQMPDGTTVARVAARRKGQIDRVLGTVGRVDSAQAESLRAEIIRQMDKAVKRDIEDSVHFPASFDLHGANTRPQNMPTLAL